MRGLMIAFFCLHCESMIARVDATAYGVLLFDLLLRVQMIANPGKTRNSQILAIKTSPTVYMYITMYMYNVYLYMCIYMYMYIYVGDGFITRPILKRAIRLQSWSAGLISSPMGLKPA